MKKFVRVIIKNNNGDFLIVNQLNGGANFPGGKIEANESSEEAAKREVLEETGLIINDLKLVHNSMFELGKDNWDGYFFTASYDGNPINKEPTKIKEIGFKNKEWIKENASKVFVNDVLMVIESNSKRKHRI